VCTRCLVPHPGPIELLDRLWVVLLRDGPLTGQGAAAGREPEGPRRPARERTGLDLFEGGRRNVLVPVAHGRLDELGKADAFESQLVALQTRAAATRASA
jgi:hypothetical protein